jgi:hypothetical protein
MVVGVEVRRGSGQLKWKVEVRVEMDEESGKVGKGRGRNVLN